MSTTITVRTDDALREELRKRAESQGKSLSEVVREILRDAVAERPLKERTGHLKGKLKLSSRSLESWRKELRQRNWRW